MLKKMFTTIGVLFVAMVGCSVLADSGDDVSASTDDTTTVTTDSEDSTEVEEVADEEPAKEAKPAPVKAMRVGAGKLVKEFENNELQADAKYKGKTLRITGEVIEVDTELFEDDKYYVSLGSGAQWEFLYVNCHDMSTDELATLKVGKTVSVIGKFDDGGDLGVEVKDCQLA